MLALTPLQLIIHESPYSVSETVDRLERGIKAKGINVFAVIDHSGAAHQADMDLQEEKVIIFGDPKVGTFLMQENPLIAMELPLRILIYQNPVGHTEIAYIDPLSLGESYHIKKNSEVLKKMSAGLAHLVSETIDKEPVGEFNVLM